MADYPSERDTVYSEDIEALGLSEDYIESIDNDGFNRYYDDAKKALEWYNAGWRGKDFITIKEILPELEALEKGEEVDASECAKSLFRDGRTSIEIKKIFEEETVISFLFAIQRRTSPRIELENAAFSLYDGDWRSSDREQLISEYWLTDDEADIICDKLSELEENEDNIDD